MSLLQCSKLFENFPAAHRAPRHDGHCAFVHGHNYDFEIDLAARETDQNGFVFDFGKMGEIKEFLKHWFDHTLVLPDNDPHLAIFKRFAEPWDEEANGFCLGSNSPLFQLRVIDAKYGTSAEGMARFILREVQGILDNIPDAVARGVVVEAVTVWEDSKNKASCITGLLDFVSE